MSHPDAEAQTGRLTVVVEGAALPVDEQERERLLESLPDEVEALLEAERGLAVVDVDCFVGHRYAAVQPECPRCGAELDLLSIHRDDENGAYAAAWCADEGCDWTGDAVYRMIDIDEYVDDHYESAVLAGAIDPEYCAYSSRSDVG